VGGVPWNKGLTIASSEKLKFLSERLSLKYKNQELQPSFKGKTHTVAYKVRMSDLIKSRYEDGWQPKAGRCKKIKYESSIAGSISVDGTWELATAKYLDTLGVQWIRNTKRFDYVDDVGVSRKYTPDFYVKDWSSYLEVKGYETDLDRAKWRGFPEKLIIWKERELRNLNILE